MLSKKGFTLIELMVVVLIVSILAAVIIPIMRGRIDSAKWSEGRAMAGTIATGLRAYAAEYGDTTGTTPPPSPSGLLSGNAGPLLGFAPGDLDGKYFKEEDFSISDYSYDPASDPPLEYLITIQGANLTPGQRTLDHLGEWNPN